MKDIKTQVEQYVRLAAIPRNPEVDHEALVSTVTTQILKLINEARREGFEEGFKVNEILKLYASRESNE